MVDSSAAEVSLIKALEDMEEFLNGNGPALCPPAESMDHQKTLVDLLMTLDNILGRGTVGKDVLHGLFNQCPYLRTHLMEFFGKQSGLRVEVEAVSTAATSEDSVFVPVPSIAVDDIMTNGWRSILTELQHEIGQMESKFAALTRKDNYQQGAAQTIISTTAARLCNQLWQACEARDEMIDEIKMKMSRYRLITKKLVRLVQEKHPKDSEGTFSSLSQDDPDLAQDTECSQADTASSHHSISPPSIGSVRAASLESSCIEKFPAQMNGYPIVRTYGPDTDGDFSTFSHARISEWLIAEGLEEFQNQALEFAKTGSDLISVSIKDLEARFVSPTHSPLSWRRFSLALKAAACRLPDIIGRLDYHWVSAWMEDIGLPQYKTVVTLNRIDVRTLNYLTYDDAEALGISNSFHHTCLKRAIQLLRQQKFHPAYLRTSLVTGSRSSQVMLWTNARVIEWLRSIELAEYAANLRGSGIHGALMVLEPRFNGDTLANMLSIPLSMSLVRKHLVTHFNKLLNDTCLRVKETTAASTDYVPLTSHVKSKTKKRQLSLSSLKKKSVHCLLDSTDYICPLSLEVSSKMGPPEPLTGDLLMPGNRRDSDSLTYSNPSISDRETSSVQQRAPLSPSS